MNETDFPRFAVDGTLTMAGLVEDYLNDPADKGWNAETREAYEAHFYRRILPHMGLERPAVSYTVLELEEAVSQINEAWIEHRGFEVDGYAEASISTFRRLIRQVIEFGNAHGITNLNLWGTSLSKSAVENEKSEDRRFLIPKSFTIEEELNLLNVMARTTVEEMTGEMLGLLIMMLIGGRNNEIAGLSFNSLELLAEHPNSYVLTIKQTSKIGSAELKAGGKTYNAPRRIPIPSMLQRIILRRKSFVERQIDNGILKLQDGITIEELPIACHQHEYDVRISARQITDAGTELFKAAGVSERRIREVNTFLAVNSEEELLEKDATAYLFRRNAATHFKALGLDEASITYLMGHVIEGSDFDRKMFTNPDQLWRMMRLIENHPLNVLLRDSSRASDINNELPNSVSMMEFGGTFKKVDKDEIVDVINSEYLKKMNKGGFQYGKLCKAY